MLLSLGKWQQVDIGFFWRVSNGVANGSFLCMPGWTEVGGWEECMASKLSCSYCHNVQSKAGLASYCSSFTSFLVCKWEKGGSFLFPKKGRNSSQQVWKKSHAFFSPLLFPHNDFLLRRFLLTRCMLVEAPLLLRRKGTGRLSMPKARLEE